MNRIIIAIGLLVGSFLAAWGASSTLSNLSSGNAVGTTDLFYDVQSPGQGGVKVTGAQLLNFIFGSVSGNCSATPNGSFNCVGGNSTQINAGTNIVTSGTGNNVTISTILTPTFTSITTTIASVTGWLTAAGVNMQTATVAGNLTASTAAFTGALTATGANFNTAVIAGNLTATTAQFAGFLTANGVSMSTATLVGNLTGSTAAFSGSITAGTAQFTGALSGTTAVFQTLTVNNLTPTGPNCLQETGGLVQATNSACSSGGGTPGGATTQVQFNNAGAFAGDPGFTYTTPAAVVITSGIITTSNKALSIFQTWNSSGQAFDAPLFMNILNTASAAQAKVIDLQVNGGSVFSVAPNAIGAGSAAIYLNTPTPTTSNYFAYTDSSNNVYVNAPGALHLRLGNNEVLSIGTFAGGKGGAQVQNDGRFVFGTGDDTILYRDAAVGMLGFADDTSPSSPVGMHIYNTTDQAGTNTAPTNYERGIADWTTITNSFTLGTQQGGTGIGRNVVIVSSNTRAQTISSTATTFAAALNAPAIAQLSANTTGYACWTTGTGAISEDSVTCLASLRRLKKDIVPFIDATRELMALKPSQFQWKNPADANQRGLQLGFIAEDVHDVDARLSSYDGSGNLHGWRQDAMIAALVRGFQEQQAIIQRQQAEIDELKQGRLP